MVQTLSEIVEKARQELSQLTGLELSTTVSTEKTEKGWSVWVELVEKHSIPDGMDLLASYEIIVDDLGNPLSFKRVRMRKRMDSAVELEKE